MIMTVLLLKKQKIPTFQVLHSNFTDTVKEQKHHQSDLLKVSKVEAVIRVNGPLQCYSYYSYGALVCQQYFNAVGG